jgi:hypothetical protein
MFVIVELLYGGEKGKKNKRASTILEYIISA